MGYMEDAVILDGLDIVRAQRATSAILGVVLADHDTSFDRWAVLDALATGSFPPDRARLLPGLADALATAPAAVEVVLDDAEADRLVRIVSAPDGDAGAARIELTPAGEAQHRILLSALVLVAAKLYMGIPERDLAAAHHVLAEVSRRADGWMELWSAVRPQEPVR